MFLGLICLGVSVLLATVVAVVVLNPQNVVAVIIYFLKYVAQYLIGGERFSLFCLLSPSERQELCLPYQSLPPHTFGIFFNGTLYIDVYCLHSLQSTSLVHVIHLEPSIEPLEHILILYCLKLLFISMSLVVSICNSFHLCVSFLVFNR